MKRRYLIFPLFFIILLVVMAWGINYLYYNIFVPQQYEEIDCPTPNIGQGQNEVCGIVLHHTAGKSLEDDLGYLTNKETEVSCHVLIARNGTRYILAQPEQITWHAGRSALHGRTGANMFTIGIEFQGNTQVDRLTKRQIMSAIEYILPIVEQYHIPIENIVTHEMVRNEWIELQRDSTCAMKCDITLIEYKRFMTEYNKLNK